MCENVECYAKASPNWEGMYNELLEQYEILKCQLEDMRTKANYYETEDLKNRTIIAAMEFALGRKFGR